MAITNKISTDPAAPRAGRGVLILVAILLAALALRVGYVTTLGNGPSTVRDRVAVSIAEGFARTGRLVYYNRPPGVAVDIGPRDYARRTPLYPMFVAMHIRFFGPTWWPRILRLSQSLLGLLTCVGIYLLGRRLGGRRVGLVAMTLGAISPLFIYQDGMIGHQCMLTAWLSWAMVFIIRRKTAYLQALAGGLCLAGAALTSASVLMLMPVLLLILLSGTKYARGAGENTDAEGVDAPPLPRMGNRIMAVLVIAIVTLCPLLIWGARNARLINQASEPVVTPEQEDAWASLRGFVLGDTSMGIVFNDGNGKHATGAPLPKREPASRTNADGWSERKFEMLHWNKAFTEIQRDRVKALSRAGGKIVRMYSPIPSAKGFSVPRYAIIGFLWWVPLSAAAVAGLVLAIRRRWPVGLLLAVPIYLTVVHAVFVASISDRLGGEPVFIVLAALVIVRLFGGARRCEEAGGDAV